VITRNRSSVIKFYHPGRTLVAGLALDSRFLLLIMRIMGYNWRTGRSERGDQQNCFALIIDREMPD
jgi:hypothetical protein